MTEHDAGIRLPLTDDEELLAAQQPLVEALRTDDERVDRMRADLEMGFRSLADVVCGVSVFGSSRVASDHADYRTGRQVGAALARAGFTVITGGGPGVMEAANRGAREAGGRSVGLNVELPFEERPNAHLDVHVTFHYFFARKVCFVRYATAFVVLPGGFGTLDELFEALTLLQTRKVRHFPVVLVGRDHWEPVWEWVRDRLVGGGYVSPTDVDLVALCDDPEDAVDLVLRGATAQGLAPAA